MKTIAQLATEIGVSKQAIHKKIKQEPLSTSLRKFTTTKGNTIYIEVDGEFLIKSAFNKSEPTTPTTESVDDIVNKFIISLQKQVDTLTQQNCDLIKQLEHEREYSRDQSDRISELAAELAQLVGNAQKLHAGDMIPKLAIEQEQCEVEIKTKDNKITLFKRLFGIKK